MHSNSEIGDTHMSKNLATMPPEVKAFTQDIISKLEVVFLQIATESDVLIEKIFGIVAKNNRQWREKAVYQLCNKGFSKKEIARELEVSIPAISVIVSKLIKEDKIKPYLRGRRRISEEECRGREKKSLIWLKDVQRLRKLESLSILLENVSAN